MSDEPIKIDTDIPMPDLRAYRPKYPFQEMKIGDSFLVRSPYGRQIATTGTKRHKPKKFIARRVPDPSGSAFRIWRVE